ncbi:glycoside hydrolase family 3 protein [Lentithecium fluviatile CBS 122367]|uniref:beta-glucosidase n=1 Tax=Lentithecium fluviatile CBS 122367 TaxID=1168545 RepID=A0A6G1J2F0_9PLEO|nr:glycoside hydrolase family 3 protein [Lentithecium fluviatile CBS 122367]
MVLMMDSKVNKILQSLTLEEKISVLAGKDFWETVSVQSKGVPSIKTSDGPNGARGAIFTGGTRAACFPAAVCSAATWNPRLSRRVGEALAEETHTKGACVLLGPTMCNHRHPLGGRNFESFSEDPHLTGKLAAQVVAGIQSKGVAATVKHFAANEQETERLSVNEIVSERALREIYLKPFEIAIKEANPWAVMTAYNKVNGFHADSHQFLLKEVLRGEWDWKGVVMSDWGGTNSTADSLNAGLDLEMPGPTRFRTYKAVKEAIMNREVSESTIDDRVRNILKLIEKVGGFENPEIPPERSVDDPKHRDLIREVAGQGIVLLKNDHDVLPLKKEELKGKKVALLGLAKEALIHGGGSASLHSHYRISPWDGLRSTYGDDVQFKFAMGAHIYRLLPPLSAHCTDAEGKAGWTLQFFEHGKHGKPVQTTHGHKEAAFSALGGFESKFRDLQLSTTFIPPESGSHYLGCSGLGPTIVTINDQVVFHQKGNCEDAMAFLFGGIPEEEFNYSFTKGVSYQIRIQTSPPEGGNDQGGILAGLPGFRLGFMNASKHDEDLVSEAVDVARDCDYAIVFTGHTPVWETEGQDQLSFNLPKDGSQDRLVDAVASANSKTIVVNSTGVAIAMPWLSKVSAVLQAWFPGQEAGNAIADVISGAVNPSGRLPISWPKRIEDSPAYGNFPGIKKDGQLTVKYDEGVFVGYRHYDRLSQDRVQFPFGFGLSYTTFSLTGGRVSQSSSGVFTANITATNTGKQAGATVIQLYIGRAQQSSDHPIKTLAAFQKVFLEAGDEKQVGLKVAPKDFAYFDEASGEWKVDRGRYEFWFGQSTQQVGDVVSVDIEGTRVMKL